MSQLRIANFKHDDHHEAQQPHGPHGPTHEAQPPDAPDGLACLPEQAADLGQLWMSWSQSFFSLSVAFSGLYVQVYFRSEMGRPFSTRSCGHPVWPHVNR